ncbi:MAG TPA: type VI secretion system-associated FHA domain protein TagH [Steroidobacteraceae bacterium]|nr:type VI secretion system-associated FHA domain protein TagH [Steroidobacteraceae bacterium]
MALRLRIISDHRRTLGDYGTMLFDRVGGTIGRSGDNDWVLPDNQRYVSAHHARIMYRDGLYILEDLSTNGTFVNDDPRALARNGPRVLQNGDVLRLGEYQLVVVLDPPAAMQVEVLSRVGAVHDADIGSSLVLDQLLVQGSGQGNGASPSRPRTPVAHGASPATTAPAPALTAAPVSTAESDDEAEATARRITRLSNAAARSDQRRAAAAEGAGFAAFCKGAGIDPEQLPADARTRLLQLAGQLFREALLGLKDLERVRYEVMGPYRLAPPSEDDDPRPSLTRSGSDEVLVQVLSQHERQRLDAVQWMRDVMTGARSHERAVMEAMQAALLQLLARLDPAELEPRFERSTRRTANAPDTGTGNVRYWELYGDFYRSLSDKAGGGLPHAFSEAFAEAYHETLAKSRG